MMCLHSRVNKFLGSLLELLLRRLRVGVGHHARLILDFDVDGQPLGIGLLLLLTLSALIASIHGVVHHAAVERIIALLLLILGARHNGTSYDA
jgi:hypothetical protein